MFDLFQNHPIPTMQEEQGTDRHTHKMAIPQVIGKYLPYLV